MRTIVITGRTGVGKSRLLAKLASSSRIAFVDPLANPPLGWLRPDPASCAGVVVDHAYHLANAMDTMAEIVAWCEQQSVPLWIAEQRLADLRAKGIELQGTFELNLLYPDEATPFDPSDKRVSVTFDAGVKLAEEFFA